MDTVNKWLDNIMGKRAKLSINLRYQDGSVLIKNITKVERFDRRVNITLEDYEYIYKMNANTIADTPESNYGNLVINTIDNVCVTISIR